ncbi:hypothetical protein G9A89_016772 [Geosiphon pyriformis]|nr:hypothetical protein G9A89_016772 [Geosiphon pyriformis]
MEDIAIDKRQTLCLIIKELNRLSQQNYTEDVLPIIESTKHYHFYYLPSLLITFGAFCEIINSQKQSTPEIHKSGDYWNTETAYTESDFCNYINAKIDCLLGHTTDTGRLGEQIHQSLLGYSTATTIQAITKTLLESDPEEYEDESNNFITVQAKFMVNKKPRFLSPTTPSYYQTFQSRIVFNSLPETQLETPQTPENPYSWNQHSWTKSLGEYGLLFGNLSPTFNKTDSNTLTWEPPPTQLLTELSATPSKETAIL